MNFTPKKLNLMAMKVAHWQRQHPRCVFGSHNASNTADAVARTSEIAIAKLMYYLGLGKT